MFRWTRGGVEDRWHGLTHPGAYEWWGFEALDTERQLAFSLRISAGDPIDPSYARILSRRSDGDPTGGDATVARPDRHVLVRVVVYRQRRRVLARTFRPEPGLFAASATSGAVRAGDVTVQVEEKPSNRAYHLAIEPGTRLTFQGPPGQAAGTEPLAGPVWDLAPLDLRVSGTIAIPGRAGEGPRHMEFSGRGVHDHGAGPASPVPGVRSWAWGWAHAWEFAVAWRQVVLESGEIDSVLIVDREGRPFIGEAVRSRRFRPRYSILGVRHSRQWRLDASRAGLAIERSSTLASSPLGMRFLTNIRLSVHDADGQMRLVDGFGLSSVARPVRARQAPWRWLTLARDRWTSQRS